MTNKNLIMIIALFFLYNLIFLADSSALLWDEAVYASMGRYAYEGKGLWEPIRPIGLPILIMLYWPFGVELALLLGKLTIVLIAGGIIWLTFLVGKEHFGERAALFASAILAVTPLFVEYSSYILTGIPSTFLILLAYYCYLKDKYFLCGIFTAIAFLTRFPAGLWLIMFPLIFKIEKKGRSSHFLAGAAIPVTTFLAANQLMYGNLAFPIIEALKHQSNAVYAQKWHHYFFELAKNNPLLLLAFFSIKKDQAKNKCKARVQSKSRYGLIIPIIAYLTYFSLIPNKQLRFALIILPFIALLAGNSLNELISRKKILILLLLIAIFPLAKIVMHKEAKNEIPYEAFGQLEGPVLTLYPTPTLYAEAVFIPFYENVSEAHHIYGEKKNNVNTIFYYDDFYPCPDNECEKEKKALYERIASENRIVFRREPYTIFAVS